MPVSSSTIRILCMLRRHRHQRRLWNYRQLYDKARSHGLIFLHADRSVMLFDDAAHDCETEAGSALSRGEIRQEKFFLQLAGYAMAGICDGDFDGVATGHQRS